MTRTDPIAPLWVPTFSINGDKVKFDDVNIEFERTIRVPDNNQISELPPSLGNFPLKYVGDHATTMSETMVAKGGIFFPMYQSEAMWINFSSKMPYAVKIYVGGINAVSGEPMVETAATILRRRQLLASGKSLQDYVVLPEQPWLDGIATEPGKVRQFVATPVGKGYSVEAQITGVEVTNGIQFEITPLLPKQIELTIIEAHCAPYTILTWTNEHMSNVRLQLELGPEDTLLHNMNALSTTKTLAHARITTDASITVMRHSSPSAGFKSRVRCERIQVHDSAIDSSTSRAVMVSVSLDDTVDDLKHLLQPAAQYMSNKVQVYNQMLESSLPLPLDGRLVLRTVLSGNNTLWANFTPKGSRDMFIGLKTLTGKTLKIYCQEDCTVDELKSKIQHFEDIPADHQRLVYNGKQLEDARKLDDYGIVSDSTIHLVMRLCGGGGGDMQSLPDGMEMSIAAGGLIKQTIVADKGNHDFDPSQTKLFNVQVLDSHHYRKVVGEDPPDLPPTAETYARYGYPFYSIYEEAGVVSGAFEAVKSVKQLDGMEDVQTTPNTVHIRNPGGENGYGSLFSNAAPTTPFRNVRELELAIRKKGQSLV